MKREFISDEQWLDGRLIGNCFNINVESPVLARIMYASVFANERAHVRTCTNSFVSIRIFECHFTVTASHIITDKFLSFCCIILLLLSLAQKMKRQIKINHKYNEKPKTFATSSFSFEMIKSKVIWSFFSLY